MDDRPFVASDAQQQEVLRSNVSANTASSNGSPAQSKEADPKPRDEGSIKETIEQILVAFILAFVFRAVVVEAFVIPAGSMAPTLLGAHMRFTCDDCGYAFTVNYAGRNEGDDII